MQKIITEDDAIRLNTTINKLLQKEQLEGYNEIQRFRHLAVGLTIVLNK